MQQLSIRSKIILTLLLTGLACLATGGIIGYQSGAKALSESVERQLIAQREGKKREVTSYIRNQLRLTNAVGDAPATIEAAKAFINALREMHAELQSDRSGEQADTGVLADWYTKEFLPRAVCGLSSPQLDHAMRALAWTQSASLAVQRLGADWAKSISLRFGLASGEVDVLLLKHGHEAFDIWGRTLAIARRIAVDTERGAVRVGESTYALLTDVEGFEPTAPIVAPVLGTLQTWARPATPRAPVGTAASQQPKAAE